MREAKNTPITAASAVTTPLPSILDLGIQLARLDKEHRRQGTLAMEMRKTNAEAAGHADAAMGLLWDQGSALRDLICAMPAVTLADAAVQISIANLLATNTGTDHPDDVKAAERDGVTLERITLSVLPVIAAAAGLDLEAMDWTQYVGLRTARFGNLEAQA